MKSVKAKRLFSIVLASLSVFFLALSCKVDVEEVHVESVTITASKTEVEVGSTITLTASVLPENATDKTVIWTSSNVNTATVSDAGVVKGIAAGSVTITATSGSEKDTKTITVKDLPAQDPVEPENPEDPEEPEVPAKNISDCLSFTIKSGVGGAWIHLIGEWKDSDFSLSESSLIVSDDKKPVIDSSINFNQILTGEGRSTSSSRTWGVDFKSAGFISQTTHTLVFYLNVNGSCYKVTLPFIGKLSNEDEEFEKSGETTFEFVEKMSPPSGSGEQGGSGSGSGSGSSGSGGSSGTSPSEDLTGITISGSSSVKVTSQINLSASPVPESASLGTVKWTSSDESIALVSSKGTVTGLKTGSVTIKAVAGTFEATKTITVTEDVDPESLVTKPGDISPEAGRTVPFGVVLDGNAGNGQFTICSGGGMNPMPSYWDLFITGGDYTDKKVILRSNGVVGVTVGKAGTYNLTMYNVWVEDGEPHYSQPWTGSVTVTSNKEEVVLPSDAEARLANRTLVQKKATSTLTLQFENNTGYWRDDQIWVTGYGRNAIGEWCYLNKDGTAIPIQAGTTSEDWSFRFSDVDPNWGLQLKDFSSSRIYFTCGNEPVTMNAVIDGNGNVGVAQPNMAIENDANAHKYFDWIEFTAGNVLYVNTTQVDAFTFPIVVADYADDGMGGYEWKKSVGVTKSRAEVFAAWDTWTNTYTHYKNLVRCDGKRILAPCKVPKSDFDMTYMDAYIADVWNYYKTHDLNYSENEHGTYKGRVHEIKGKDGNMKNVLIMTRAGDSKKFYVYDTPNMEEAFEGSGKLAMDCSPGQSMEWFGTEAYGNTETSKNVQNRICSAFTRHAFIKQGGDYINVMDDPSRYYSEEPANMYSAFFHKEAGNLDGFAYGFAYDDNHDQSTTTVDGNCRGVVVGIGRWE